MVTSFEIQFQFMWFDDEYARGMDQEELRNFLMATHDSHYPRYVQYIIEMIYNSDLSNRFMDDEEEYIRRLAQCISFNRDNIVATLNLPRRLWCTDGPYYNEHFLHHMREFYVDELRDFVASDIETREDNPTGPSICVHQSNAIVTVNII